MWPFRSRSILEEDEEAWQVDTWRWMLEEKGGLPDLKRAQLVLPTPAFFPATELTGHDRVAHIFERIKDLAGLGDWPCRLLAQPDRGGLTVNPVTALKARRSAPAGTYLREGNIAEISYDPKLVADPWGLVATLAHELSHYFFDGYRKMPPGGAEGIEPATDLGVVYLGFGLFAANSAFQFQQTQDFQSQGWSYSRLGYLKEREWVFALAVFLVLREIDPKPATAHLKPHFASQLKRTIRYLNDNPAIGASIAAAGSA